MSISISGNGSFTGATADYSFDQSVGIAGTLTYEDVTSIDSVGVITARSGIDVGPTSGIGATISSIGNISGRSFSALRTGQGYVYVSGSGVSGLSIYGTDNSTIKGKLGWDGSATFAGAVEVSISNGGNAVWNGKVGSTLNSQILGNGSAYFGGNSGGANIELNNDGSTTFGSSSNCRLQYVVNAGNNSVVNIRAASSTNNTATAFNVINSSGDSAASILYNGSATFAGNVTSGGPAIIGGTDKGSFIGYEGNSGFTAGSSSSAIRVWTQGDSTPTVDILGSGNATFAGDITCNQNLLIRGGDANGVYIRNAADTSWNAQIQGNGLATFKNKLTVQVDSATPIDSADIYNGISGGDNRVKIRTFANGGGDPYLFFDGGGNNMVVGESYAGTTSNELVMGTGNSASAVTGLRINGLGKVTCDDSFYVSSSGTNNALKFLYDISSGDATIGPDSNGGSTQLYLGASNAGTYQNYVQINSVGNLTSAIIDGSNGANCIVARHWNTGSAGPYLYLGYSGATTFGNGTYRYSVTSNGDVKNTNNSYGAISDINLKENIVDATSQWSDIKQLRLRNYNFKENTGYETNTQLGLIAQEAEIICPNIVETFNVPEEEERSLKSIKYSVLYMKAIKALQEAMARIETLEAKVQALEGS